ncbi:MAG: hypothetical protein ABFD97_11725 [Syntrophobacter sp.]
MIFLPFGCAHQQVSLVNTQTVSPYVPEAPKQAKHANFQQEYKSENARRMADWVVDSRDNGGLPFAIVDKVDARVFVFHVDGQLRGSAPVLLGLSKGDDSIPDIGERKMSEIRPEERTTPAGRFHAVMGDNYNGKDVLWVDYENAISMHRVVTSNPKERRLERLASPKPTERRISFGCINVPADFFDKVVKPSFTGSGGMVYVLPETRSIDEIFVTYYDVEKSPKKLQN